MMTFPFQCLLSTKWIWILWTDGITGASKNIDGLKTPVKLVTYYLFDIRGAKQGLPNK